MAKWITVQSESERCGNCRVLMPHGSIAALLCGSLMRCPECARRAGVTRPTRESLEQLTRPPEPTPQPPASFTALSNAGRRIFDHKAAAAGERE